MADKSSMVTEARQPSQTTVAEGLASEDDAAALGLCQLVNNETTLSLTLAMPARLGYKQELRRNFTMLEVFGGLYWWTHCFASPKTRNALSFLVGYSNTLGLVGGLCSIDYGFSLMFVSVIVIARDGNWTPSNGVIFAVFLACVLCHGVLASTLSKVMGKLQTVFVVMNFVLIFATIIALPIGRASQRNSKGFIFGETANLTTWPTGWTFMLSWLSFDACVHMSEEAANATRAVPYGILMSIGSCWLFGFILVIVIAACMTPDFESLLSSPFGQPMAQIYYDAIGKNGTLGLMSLLFIVQFLMGLSITVAASRQAWAFSRDGALPFSSFFRVISKKFGYIPLRAVWGCVLLAAVLGLLCLIAPAAAQALFSLAVAGNNVAWGVPILARVVWGQKKFKPGPFYTGRYSVVIAWTAVVFLAFGIILSMFPVGGPDPTPQTMNYTVVINSAVWGGALAYYFIDARKWFVGPKITLDLDDLSESQEKALQDEGLEIQGLPTRRSRSLGESDGPQHGNGAEKV
ncbi:hypothetical protein LTR28_007922 [Elasticomyces elasticus]|nr:hypothetical protein LTR28_007922 [Elasticomyces elasticus]